MEYSRILDTYSLGEILEYNDVEEVEVLQQLVESGHLRLPPIPIDAYYDTSD